LAKAINNNKKDTNRNNKKKRLWATTTTATTRNKPSQQKNRQQQHENYQFKCLKQNQQAAGKKKLSQIKIQPRAFFCLNLNPSEMFKIKCYKKNTHKKCYIN